MVGVKNDRQSLNHVRCVFSGQTLSQLSEIEPFVGNHLTNGPHQLFRKNKLILRETGTFIDRMIIITSGFKQQTLLKEIKWFRKVHALPYLIEFRIPSSLSTTITLSNTWIYLQRRGTISNVGILIWKGNRYLIVTTAYQRKKYWKFTIDSPRVKMRFASAYSKVKKLP